MNPNHSQSGWKVGPIPERDLSKEHPCPVCGGTRQHSQACACNRVGHVPWSGQWTPGESHGH